MDEVGVHQDQEQTDEVETDGLKDLLGRLRSSRSRHGSGASSVDGASAAERSNNNDLETRPAQCV